MTNPLPDPPVPADVDLRDFGFMPVDVVRVRDSRLAAELTPEQCWAAFLLWCASWHQVPAGSIPDSTDWQAKHAGYRSRGRNDPAWEEIRPGALRGFNLCSDGRLYHEVVCEKALEAWQQRTGRGVVVENELDRKQRWRAKLQRQAQLLRAAGVTVPRHPSKAVLLALCEKHGVNPDAEPPDGATLGVDKSRRTGVAPSVAPEGDGVDAGVDAGVDGATVGPRNGATQRGDAESTYENEGSDDGWCDGGATLGVDGATVVTTDKRGRGTGTGTVLIPDSVAGARANPAPVEPGETRPETPPEQRVVQPTAAGRICRLMRQAGCPDSNPGHPDLLALIASGASDAEFEWAAREAKLKRSGFAYALGALKGARGRAGKLALMSGPMPVTREQPPSRLDRRAATIGTLTGKDRHATQPAPAAPAPADVVDVPARVVR